MVSNRELTPPITLSCSPPSPKDLNPASPHPSQSMPTRRDIDNKPRYYLELKIKNEIRLCDIIY